MSDVFLDKGYARAIIEQGSDYGCLRNQLAYILATAEWETAHTMEPVKEAYWLDEAWRANNLDYYPWYGRGFVQLTWEANYEKAQEELDLGTLLTDDPDKAMEPDIAAQVIVKGSMEGWFTGKAIPDYCTLSASDYINARRVINGTNKASEIASLATEFEALLKDEGYGEDDPDPETHPDVPDLPSVDLTTDQLLAVLTKNAEAMEDMRDRISALEKWRKS